MRAPNPIIRLTGMASARGKYTEGDGLVPEHAMDFTLRDLFAAAALVQILGECGYKEAATISYGIADAMLAERVK